MREMGELGLTPDEYQNFKRERGDFDEDGRRDGES